MTQERLEALRSLQREAQLLQEELRRLPQTKDSVKGSMAEHPYIEHTVIVSGVDEQQAERLCRQLQRKLNRIQEEVEAMEQWLDEVDDAEMRTILRLRYRNGVSWQGVALQMGKTGDGSTERKKCKKFWEQLKVS